jgi:hypothetical protein
LFQCSAVPSLHVGVSRIDLSQKLRYELGLDSLVFVIFQVNSLYQFWVFTEALRQPGKHGFPERMESYRADKAEDALTCIARYQWNIALCEALVPSIHVFEIAVRNAVHGSMVHSEKVDAWYDIPGMLEPKEAEEVERAKERIAPKTPPRRGWSPNLR